MSNATLTTDLLKSRQHFEILDGLRGVAAISVVVFHFMEWVHFDYSKNFIGHGFLAVDFFFCLSGFVIGYAYDNRIRTMGTKEFFKSRLIRLHPLVVLGAILGVLGFLFDPLSNDANSYSSGMIALLFACTVLLIPFPVMEDRAFNLFGLNAPSWSLFWEYIANIAYAFILCKLKRRTLLAVALVSAAALCFIGIRSGNLMGGWSKASIADGGVRVAFSFVAGLLIYRSNWIIKNRLGFLGISALLVVAFVMPFFKWNWLVEVVMVVIYFPLLVSLGAGSALSVKTRKACVFSGDISYPLYMTHYAWIWLFGSYLKRYAPGTGELVVVITLGTIGLIGLSYLMLKVYDQPIRRYLTNRRQQKMKEKEAIRAKAATACAAQNSK